MHSLSAFLVIAALCTLAVAAGNIDCPVKPSKLVNRDQFMDLHNQARHLCQAPELEWDESLACYSQQVADKCIFKHSGRAKFGENIAAGYGNGYDIEQAVQSWFDEFKETNWKPTDGYTEASGHATQMGWQATTKVGCGVQSCSASSLGLSSGNEPAIFVVCQYYEAGNVIGQFAEQVKVPAGSPSISLSKSGSLKTPKIAPQLQQSAKSDVSQTTNDGDTYVPQTSNKAVTSNKSAKDCPEDTQKTGKLPAAMQQWVDEQKAKLASGQISSYHYSFTEPANQKRSAGGTGAAPLYKRAVQRKGTPRFVSLGAGHKRFNKRRTLSRPH